MISDYRSGMTLEAVATKNRMGKPKLKAIFAEHGVEIRSKGHRNDWEKIGDTRNLKKKLLKWDYEACKEEARKYKNRTEMQEKNQSAYNAARRYGWLDDFFEMTQTPLGYWKDLQRCIEASRECENVPDFKNKYKGAYSSARRNGWLDKMEYRNPSKPFTTEDFKARVIARNGDKFDLTDSVYVNSHTKVKAVCRKHGPFEAQPCAFYNGIACPGCMREAASERKSSDLEEFKRKYREKFGDRLNFDKSVYNGSSVKMTVTCPIHGDFEQTPNKLLEGFGCHACTKEKVKKEKTLTQEEFLKRVHESFGDLYDTSISEYKSIRERVKLICPEHGVFEQTPEMLFNGYGCPHCSNQTSIKERELIEFIASLIGCDNVKTKDRSVLEGKEIDILIPSKKIGIGYNGNWSHTEENGNDRNYHISKTELAESKGYRLIQIFEDEYINHKDIVLEKITHMLGCDRGKTRVGARKCSITEVGKDEAKEFLDKWHIQGFAGATVYYGAFYNDTLVGVMTFLEEKKGFWNLNRYSTNTGYSIPGLASKMFRHFLNNNSVIQVKSFLDRRWGKSGDSVYERMGFKLESVIPPDYRYLVGGERVHKFNFRKQALNKKHGLPMTMTETEMTQELGIPRIWDCGLVKYVYTNGGVQNETVEARNTQSRHMAS